MANVRTWSQSMDNMVNDYSTATLVCKSLAFQIKKGLLLAGWTVTGSSDGTPADGAGMDGNDRMTTSWDATKWICAAEGSNHSWFVMRHAGLGHSVCFNMTSANYFTWGWARAEFTGGTVTNRPTSTEECWSGLLTQALFDNTATPHRISMLYNTDGDFIFMIVKGLTGSGIGHVVSNISLLKLSDLAAGDSWPCVGWQYYVNTGSMFMAAIQSMNTMFFSKDIAGRTMNYSAFSNNTTTLLLPYINASPMVAYASLSGPNRGSMLNMPVLVWHGDFAAPYAHSDYKGKMVDIEWCITQTGQGFMNTAVPATRVRIGDFWVPLTVSPSWN